MSLFVALLLAGGILLDQTDNDPARTRSRPFSFWRLF